MARKRLDMKCSKCGREYASAPYSYPVKKGTTIVCQKCWLQENKRLYLLNKEVEDVPGVHKAGHYSIG